MKNSDTSHDNLIILNLEGNTEDLEQSKINNKY